ncbi:MAG: preprotein translocase subunit SecA [Christensenellaceae bacterium]|jgi:preprotein translocase subunit SecA
MALFKREDKFLRKARKIADQVAAQQEYFNGLSDAELAGKTEVFRARYQDGETLDDLLPEVFAQVREAARRVLGLEHYYVQILGGIILHNGDIAEMKTGEGKTLAATLPVCLNALAGKGVHVVTVNEYLAKRDSEWMGKLYNFLGYSVGLITREGSVEEKQAAYNADITYGTNNEFGFDYLRDNMKVRKEDLTQRPLFYAIVDEVDSILIDEARTPLIISGAGDKGTEMYEVADRFVRTLKNEVDYVIEEKQKTINLTEDGVRSAESYFGIDNLTDMENITINHHINQALRANYIMRRDIDYVVQDGQVLIVDEFTGRLMIGRRYSDGLHQAIEAKEKVTVERESKTLATITFQNYFRMYEKLAGMTGTAKTEENEFQGIYGLAVVEIPTHRPMIREDRNDVVLPTVQSKFTAVIEEIVAVHETGQPMLVGTVSVEHSELLSKMLKRRGVPHEVLNAKHHEREAHIIAQTGKYGAVTIATNMAGRGTDILLGGNADYMAKSDMRKQGYDEDMIYSASMLLETEEPEILEARRIYHHLLEQHEATTSLEHDKVIAAGGLYIIGTERHESRRIDNQLRGRAGRQGDPGASRFYVALEDDLMRLFGGERIRMILDRFSAGEDIPLEFGMISKQIERAQKRIEERNYTARSHVLKYDDVMNKQREVIYGERKKVLMGEDLSSTITEMISSAIEATVGTYITGNMAKRDYDISALILGLYDMIPRVYWTLSETTLGEMDFAALQGYVLSEAMEAYEKKQAELEAEGLDMREVERVVMLRAVDDKWMDHIDNMEELRQGIGLRSYGQMDPVVAFQTESYDMFDEMIASIQRDTARMLFGVTVRSRVEREEVMQPMEANYDDAEEAKKAPKRVEKKVGRNDLCPCGSGKKYKNCHGRQG